MAKATVEDLLVAIHLVNPAYQEPFTEKELQRDIGSHEKQCKKHFGIKYKDGFSDGDQEYRGSPKIHNALQELREHKPPIITAAVSGKVSKMKFTSNAVKYNRLVTGKRIGTKKNEGLKAFASEITEAEEIQWGS